MGRHGVASTLSSLIEFLYPNIAEGKDFKDKNGTFYMRFIRRHTKARIWEELYSNQWRFFHHLRMFGQDESASISSYLFPVMKGTQVLKVDLL